MTLFDFIGLPYLPKGRDINGLDCWGLVHLFYREVLHLEVPSYVDTYTTSEEKRSVAVAIEKHLPDWQRVEKAQYGDMLVFNILGLPIHTGVYLSEDNFLHAFKGTNVCIERLNSSLWNKRLLGIYRWAKT